MTERLFSVSILIWFFCCCCWCTILPQLCLEWQYSVLGTPLASQSLLSTSRSICKVRINLLAPLDVTLKTATTNYLSFRCASLLVNIYTSIHYFQVLALQMAIWVQSLTPYTAPLRISPEPHQLCSCPPLTPPPQK